MLKIFSKRAMRWGESPVSAMISPPLLPVPNVLSLCSHSLLLLPLILSLSSYPCFPSFCALINPYPSFILPNPIPSATCLHFVCSLLSNPSGSCSQSPCYLLSPSLLLAITLLLELTCSLFPVNLLIYLRQILIDPPVSIT